MHRYRILGDETIVGLEELAARVSALRPRGRRVLLGLTGAPAAGKSTLAERLADHLGPRAVVVGMDGFHLAQAELERQGIADRKGAWDTFDAAGYAALLERLRDDERPVFAPRFERSIEEPIANAVRVDAGAIVITEGNYLLDEAGDWPTVEPLLDEVWSVRGDDRVRRERLIRRHVSFGRSPEAAEAWVRTVDDPNAERIVAAGRRARLTLVELTDES